MVMMSVFRQPPPLPKMKVFMLLAMLAEGRAQFGGRYGGGGYGIGGYGEGYVGYGGGRYGGLGFGGGRYGGYPSYGYGRGAREPSGGCVIKFF